MRRPRFTIASLLVLVLFVAVGVAALRAADEAWDSGVLGATWLILLASVLLAVHRADRKRAFWLGFALFGWVYLVMSLIPPVESRLPTTKGLAYLDSKVPGREDPQASAVHWLFTGVSSQNRPVQAVAFSPDGKSLATSEKGMIRLFDAVTGKMMAAPTRNPEIFVRIGHSLLALMLAMLGGWLSRRLRDREQLRRGDPATPAPLPTSPLGASPP